jgi:hypothetical protein
MEILPLVSIGVGIAGFLFGVWAHFTTRKVAKVRYEISQFADYKMPAEFLKEVSKAPVKIRAVSLGNKSAQNVALRLKTKFPIVAYEIDPPELKPKISHNELRFEVDRLNPRQELNLFITCNGDPTVNQIETLQITHSQGVALPMTFNEPSF